MISDASTRREKLGISEDDGRVFRTEPDAVGERVSHARLAGNARNIVEVVGPQAGILDRHRHRPRRLDTGLVETHAMMGIARGPVPQNLSIDGRAAASCRRFGLHKIDPGSLAKYKSITVFRKWTRSHL